MATDGYARGGQDAKPRPPLLQTRTWQSGEPGYPAEQLLRDEASVRQLILLLGKLVFLLLHPLHSVLSILPFTLPLLSSYLVFT